MALSARDRRSLMILGAVAGVAVVFFLLTNVLGGGGGEDVAAPPPASTTGPQPAPSPTPSPTPRETLPPVLLAGDRDPFSIPPTFTGGGVSPTASPTSPGTSPTQSPTAPGGGSSASIGGHTVVLLDVFDNGTRAQIEVDGTVYTVAEGSRFDDGFRLTSIDGSCTTITHESQSYTLCVNAQK